MNGCEDIRLLMDDWLDDFLDEAARERVEAHLQTCASCRSEFDRQAAITDDLATLGRAADRIAASRATRRPTPARWFQHSTRWRRGLAAVAVVVLGLSLTLSELRHQPASPEPEAARPAGATEAGGDAPPISAFSITTPDNKLVVPCESSNPRIHIVWLYDEVRPAATSNDDNVNQTNDAPV